ncbi:MarR family transcriptional regulator [Methanococcus voltae]|uniref:MarR family transcriptional regulator n=1 Tax=Methanococcus voltae TaxID=2188 RepID=UPI001AE6140F|nr:MarR family transcriptional regulator [Methanococcus voltae]MBP2173315.1 DNA-binding HxlR family transcriptional regulator [Methanococcus voltae]
MFKKLLNKKHTFSILKILYEAEEEPYFSEIQKISKIDKSTLSLLLSEMEKYELVSKREDTSDYILPKRYYKLTPKGIETYERYKHLLDVEKDFNNKNNKNNNAKNNNNEMVNSNYSSNIQGDNTIITNSHDIVIKK